MDFQRISGENFLAEFDIVDAKEQGHLVGIGGLVIKTRSVAWAVASTVYTPGRTGAPGQWPLKISRAGFTQKVAVMRWPGISSLTLSISSMLRWQTAQLPQ